MLGLISENNFIIEVGARLLGRDVAEILSKSDLLKHHILTIIDHELQDDPGSISIYFLQRDFFVDHALIKQIFYHIKKGIEEKI